MVALDQYVWAEQSLPDSDTQEWPPHDTKRAKRLLRRADDDYVAPETLTSKYKATARKLLKRTQEAEQRFERIKTLMIVALRDGDLAAGLKPYDKPSIMNQCPRELWWPNILDQRARFYYCRLNPDGHEVARDTDGPPYCWIYIHKESLDRFLKLGGSPHPGPAEETTVQRVRGPRQRTAAKETLSKLYPNGIPSIKTHGQLQQEVIDEVGQEISERTIRRARDDIERLK
jgi:hypothetical protein